MTHSHKYLSRRQFLQASSALTASALLAACAPVAPLPPAAQAETEPSPAPDPGLAAPVDAVAVPPERPEAKPPSSSQPPPRAQSHEPQAMDPSEAGAPAAASAAPGADAPPPGASVAKPSAGEVWGQAALPSHVASLAKGFTRAVPRAAFRDPVWHRLPLGQAGKIVFSIELDAAGKVLGGARDIEQEPAPPPYLKALTERTLLMLKAGQFALSPTGIRAGAQRFEMSASIRVVDPLDDELAEPEDLRQIGRLVEPSLTRPGKANFTYNSGRQVQLSIRMLGN